MKIQSRDRSIASLCLILTFAFVLSTASWGDLAAQTSGLQGMQCATTTLTSGTTTPTTTLLGALKIFKYNDYNRDGVWQKGEVGLGGFLFKITGPQSLTVVTDRFGEAYANGLPAGTYTVTEDALRGWEVTTGNPQTVKIVSADLKEARFGNRQTPESTSSSTTSSSTTIETCTRCRDQTACGGTNDRGEECVCSNICGTETDCIWVCGLRSTTTTTIPLPGKLIIYKWNDHSGDGTWDSDEPALGGFAFTVAGPVTRTLITNELGQAYADGLPTGAYTITENLPAGWMITTDNPQIVIIPSGQTREVRFGDKQVPDTTTLPQTTSTTIPVTCTRCSDGTVCGAIDASGRQCICSGICRDYPSDCEYVCELGDKPTTTTVRSTTTTTKRKEHKTDNCCGFKEPLNQPGEPISACGNGITDYGETDVDCGGSCVPCENGKACMKNADCRSKSCHDNKCTQTYCTDGLKNVDETGVDCGGTCTPCMDGERCRQDSDCLNEDCIGQVCGGETTTTSIYRIPSCFNGLQDTDEMDVDCGGSCSQCTDQKKCMKSADCLSGYCEAGVCKTPTCSDGIQNQGETGVDCSGPCAACKKGGIGLEDYVKGFTGGLNNLLMIPVVIMLVFLLYTLGRKGDDAKKDMGAVQKATLTKK